MSQDVHRRIGPAWWLLVSLTVVVTSESVRVAFPLLYDVREDAGAGLAIVWALGGFVVFPASTPALRRVGGPDLCLKLSAALLAAARLAMQLADTIPLWLATTAVAAGLIVLVQVLHVSRARAEGAGAALAVAVGLSVDAAIRGAYETWDPVWQAGPGPTTLAAVLAGALVAAAWISDARPDRTDREPRRPWSLMLVGAFLLLETLFLQNAAFVASEYGYSIPAAVLTVMAGDAIAVAVAVVLVRHPGRAASPQVRAIVALGLLALVAATALTDVRGLVPLAHVAAIVLLLWAIDRPVAQDDPASSWRTAAASALGMALFVGGAFAYQIDIDVPLPIPRATFPVIAAIALATAAIARPYRRACPAPRRLWLLPAGLLLVVGLAFVLRGTGTTPRPTTPADPLTVMTWNIHTAVNADGNVDLATIAEEIVRLGPDVILLQEVGRGWPIAGQVDQAEWLARRLEMDMTWASAADDQFGNAILTRLPVRDAEILRLPFGEGPQYRSALRVLVDTKAGWTPWLVDTHLQNGDEASSTREGQIVVLLDAWGADAPTVLGGDLNMQPTEDNVTLFSDAELVSAQDTVGDPGASTARDPGFPGDRVDWIWMSPDLTPLGFAIVASPASDHLPLVVSVTPAGS
jgi:endonuclease/exonuclease/phosphatase family metal-dependent hydrolase